MSKITEVNLKQTMNLMNVEGITFETENRDKTIAKLNEDL